MEKFINPTIIILEIMNTVPLNYDNLIDSSLFYIIMGLSQIFEFLRHHVISLDKFMQPTLFNVF